MQFRLIGFSVIGDEKDFNFALAIFECEGKNYRCEIEDGRIVRFLRVTPDPKFKMIENGRLFMIGDVPVFGALFRGEFFQGTREEITPRLMEIYSLPDSEFDPLEKWNIGCFLKSKKMAEEALQAFLRSDRNLGLTEKNFLMPKDLR